MINYHSSTILSTTILICEWPYRGIVINVDHVVALAAGDVTITSSWGKDWEVII
jgi:hypothetical protein